MTLELEITVLTGVKSRKSLEDSSVPETVTQFLDGKFEEVLGGVVAKEILAQNKCDQVTLESCILKNVEQYMTAAAEDGQSLREFEVLVVGASCLQLFVQNNWTGPATLTNPSVFLPESFSSPQNALQQSALGYLSEDGEPAYHLAAHAAYLHAARAIFMDCRHLFKALQTWEWWLARCLMIQQWLLEQRSPTLKKNILEAMEQVGKKETLVHGDDNRDVAVLLHLEAAQMCQYYWESKMARNHVTEASKIAGINTQLTGAMGKRTRYQQEDKAQLVVKVIRSQELQPMNPVGLCDPQFSAPVPKNLPLDDDTVLDKIQFTDGEADSDTQLSPLEQTLLYAIMESHRRSVAQEKLTDEEILTYLEHILTLSSCWAVSSSCLALRSRLQKDNRRRVERSMRQLEELFNQTTRQDPPASVRLQLFFAAQPPAVWEIKSQLAVILMSLNLYGAALSMYEGLKLWEDVIYCYIQMGKKDKAHSVIKEQLQEEETPTLLCLLGDVTGDQTHYQRAWEMSNQRSARAMRCLGYICFRQEKYDEAIECFEKSLNINSLQIPVWFTCGCACMTARKYESAVAAFKRCVNIDFDNFEAWSNLATAYARLGKKRNAFLTVNEAIKCNFENWRLWENCLVFATDCGEFDEAIRAYNRLLDMKDKFSDTEVLGILVKVVVENIEDVAGQPSVRLLPKLLQLFGRVASKMTLDAETWKLYADLCLVTTPSHPADHQKAAELLQKARRSLTQANNWDQMPDDCQKVAQRVLDINKAYMTCVEQTEDSQKAKELLTKARLSLNGVVTAIRQRHTDPATKELAEPMKTDCESLDKELQAVTDRLQQLQS